MEIKVWEASGHRFSTVFVTIDPSYYELRFNSNRALLLCAILNKHCTIKKLSFDSGYLEVTLEGPDELIPLLRIISVTRRKFTAQVFTSLLQAAGSLELLRAALAPHIAEEKLLSCKDAKIDCIEWRIDNGGKICRA